MVPMNTSQPAVKALFFDVFGTLVDWRTSVAREAGSILEALGYQLDWLAFADAWRDEYQPGMEEGSLLFLTSGQRKETEKNLQVMPV